MYKKINYYNIFFANNSKKNVMLQKKMLNHIFFCFKELCNNIQQQFQQKIVLQQIVPTFFIKVMLQKKGYTTIILLRIHLQQKSLTFSTKITNNYNKKTFFTSIKNGLATKFVVYSFTTKITHYYNKNHSRLQKKNICLHQ